MLLKDGRYGGSGMDALLTGSSRNTDVRVNVACSLAVGREQGFNPCIIHSGIPYYNRHIYSIKM